MPTNVQSQPNAFPPGYRTQSGRFLALALGGVVLGGIQNYTYTETFGTHWVPEVGSDHKEPEFGAPQVNGTAQKLVINMRKLRDLIGGGDSSQMRIDFRNFQFTLVNTYQEAYIKPPYNDPTQTVPGINSGPNSPIKETVNNVMISDLTWSENDAVSLVRENITFIGTGVGPDTNAAFAGQ